MSKLILLGGPPGVGKSTVILAPLLDRITCLDADRIWNPKCNGTRAEAIKVISAAIKDELAPGKTVLLAWVFAKPALYQPFVEAFSPTAEIQQLYLVSEPKTLEARLRKRNSSDQITYALKKLELILKLPFDKIDTTNIDPDEVAEALNRMVLESV